MFQEKTFYCIIFCTSLYQGGHDIFEPFKKLCKVIYNDDSAKKQRFPAKTSTKSIKRYLELDKDGAVY